MRNHCREETIEADWNLRERETNLKVFLFKGKVRVGGRRLILTRVVSVGKRRITPKVNERSPVRDQGLRSNVFCVGRREEKKI